MIIKEFQHHEGWDWCRDFKSQFKLKIINQAEKRVQGHVFLLGTKLHTSTTHIL